MKLNNRIQNTLYKRITPNTLILGLLVFIFTFAGLLVPIYAEKMPVPADIQLTLLMKILTYDRALKERCPESINIGVLYNSKDESSVEAKGEIVDVLNKYAGRKVSKLPFEYSEVDWQSKDSLINWIQENKINMLYIAPGFSEQIKEITAITQELNILSTTGIPKYVKKGVSICIGLKNEKPQIIVNLESSKEEGVDLDAKMLRIAKLEETE